MTVTDTATSSPDRPQRGDSTRLLDVKDLVVEFPVSSGRTVQAVSGISLHLERGETLGLVGESGCGKSTVARAIMQLIRPNSGSVRLDGHELTDLRGGDLARARGEMQMVFQDPLSALNPRRRVGDLVSEGLRIRGIAESKEARAARVSDALSRVELDAEIHAGRRSHELSGGQRQRVSIARALALEPSLLVCDEIVSALDVSVQAQLLNLLVEMKEELGLSLLFIAHDLGVVRHVSDRVMVMYLGKVCEVGPVDAVFSTALHPYTRLLMNSIPTTKPGRAEPIAEETVEMPSPMSPPSGCRFRTRCPRAQARCVDEEPLRRTLGEGHEVACHFPHLP